MTENAHILIIDDEPANLKLLDKMLRSQGYSQLTLLQDSQETLASYHAHRPDLILLDLNMPQLDGYQVLAQLQELNDPLMPPVIILTAQSGRDYLLKALAAGARDFIGKPFDRVELLMRVRNLLEAHMSHRLLYKQKTVLEEMVKSRTEAINQSRLQVVRRLGRAAEYRDNETGLHIIRMSQFSALLAKGMGWCDSECELMLHASPMHDIGKIGIPDAVLLKPGKLDAAEWEVMKTHAAIGAELLSGDESPLLVMASSIARSHHEKWDGSGYPHGLKGHDIPEAGRIVAVADVFDALTSSRPYKKAWSIETATAFICDNAGSHFDPDVVTQFMENLDSILEIRNCYLDQEITLQH